MPGHIREIILVAIIGVFVGRELEAPAPMALATATSPAPDATPRCGQWDTKRTELGVESGIKGWEPFANGRSVLWRRCKHLAGPDEAPRRATPKRITLGSRSAVAQARPTMSKWLGKVVAFDMMNSAPRVGVLRSFQGTTATVVINGKPEQINLLAVRVALLE